MRVIRSLLLFAISACGANTNADQKACPQHVIEVTAGHRAYLINGGPVSAHDLRGVIKTWIASSGTNPSVILRGDPDVRFFRVYRVFTALTENNITKVRLEHRGHGSPDESFEYGVPYRWHWPSGKRDHCLAVRVVVGATGKIDFGSGAADVDVWHRWLSFAVSPTTADVKVGDIAFDRNTRYDAFFRLLKIMVESELDLVWFGPNTGEENKLGAWYFPAKDWRAPLPPMSDECPD